MFLNFYYNLPSHIDPIAFSFGSFSVRWYSVMYIVGFATVYFLLIYRVKKGETSLISNIKLQISNKTQSPKAKIKNESESQITNYELQNSILDFLLYAFLGALVGGRLGYVLFYNLSYYAKNPLAAIFPFDSSGQYIGIYGMSYFGAFIAVLIAALIFCRKRKFDFWQWGDFVAPAIPAGYFFGRIGNFLNGELYGRITSAPWGMYFPGDAFAALRHPSQIYEALLEGLLLFLVLWIWRNKAKFSGQLVFMYAIGYASARFFCEFFRQSDPQSEIFLGELLTLGQLFSLLFIIIALIGYFKRKSCVILRLENEINSSDVKRK